MTTRHTARKLGKNQRAILNALIRNKGWYPDKGWIWNTEKGTIKLLDTLVARGLAEIKPSGEYVATPKGVDEAAAAGTNHPRRLTLIAAAPDMLAALETLEAAANADGWPKGWGLVKDKVRAAIARAHSIEVTP